MEKDDLLNEYLKTGFTPQQINEMYDSLTSTFGIMSKLVCDDVELIAQSYDEIKYWLKGYLSYCKKEYN